MGTIWHWLNINNGALMVLVTVVYVVATICISRSNRKSAEASREQIAASQKQQEQNVGLQLYAMRKEAITNIAQKQYQITRWDIPMLFNDDLDDDYQKVASIADRIQKLQFSIEQFELYLNVLVGNRKSDYVIQARKEALLHGDPSSLRESLSHAFGSMDTHEKQTDSIEKYVEQVMELRELEPKLDDENNKLVLKLTAFVKESIQ